MKVYLKSGWWNGLQREVHFTKRDQCMQKISIDNDYHCDNAYRLCAYNNMFSYRPKIETDRPQNDYIMNG